MTEWAALAGRTLMVGIPGPELDRETTGRLRTISPGGVILFRRNLESAQRTARLLGQLARVLPSPTLFAIDQEGGRVSRLEGLVGSTPTAATLAGLGAAAASGFAHATGEALAGLGFNLDFAPVVDLCDAEATNGIGDRSFGTDPETVVELAGAFLDGLQRSGVAACLKHFPGLGCTRVDSHVELPVVQRDLAALEMDLFPFRHLADRAASVMVGHGHYPAWTRGDPRPATCCPGIVQAVLREGLGYRGLVVSDDMEMGAVAGLDAGGEAALGALTAGCDLLLYCSDLDRAERAVARLAEAAASDPKVARRLDEAARGVERTAARWPAPAPDLKRWDQARQELAAF